MTVIKLEWTIEMNEYNLTGHNKLNYCLIILSLKYMSYPQCDSFNDIMIFILLRFTLFKSIYNNLYFC